MNRRSTRCTDAEIIASLCSDSDSDSNIKEEKVRKKTQSDRRKLDDSKLVTKSRNQFLSNLTKESNNGRQSSVKSLKMRLRRSTEQSLYKIDIDSVYERSPQNVHISTSVINSNGTNVIRADQETRKSNEETPKKARRVSKLGIKDTDQESAIVDQQNNSHKALRPKRIISYNEENLYNSHIKKHNLTENTHSNSKDMSDSEDQESAIVDQRSNSRKVLRPKRIISYNEENLYNSHIKKHNLTENTHLKSKDTSDSELSESDVDHNNIKNNTNKSRPSIRNKRSYTLMENNKEIDDSISNAIKTRLSVRLSKIQQNDKNVHIDGNAKKVNSISSVIESEERITRSGSTSSNSDIFEKENISDVKMDIRLKAKEEKILMTPKRKRNAQSDIKNDDFKDVLITPKSRGTPSHSSLTPSMERRKTILVKPMTPLQEARAKLHVSVVPKSLPCREEEFNNIFTFLEGKLMDGTGGCIYISGVPGTGKTATVNEVIRCLQRLVTKRQLQDFKFVEINGMKLSEPRQAYVHILKQLTGQTLTWEQAYQKLEKRFNKVDTNRLMTLLLVDELDLLCTKRQDVVYNLLDWPTKMSAQLVVITIANTMDLPERVLMGRVTSRLGLTRLTFQPYNHKQLQEIVITRLQHTNAFRSEAIQLIARKVSAVSGDARRALDICRRATEITELRKGEMVSMEDVNQALSEMIASAKVNAIKHCSKMEQIFLQAVCTEVERTGVEETIFKNIYYQIESLCSFDGIKVPTVTEALTICGRLGANRLLICEHSKADIYQRILLNVSPDDIYYAMQKLNLD